MAEKLLLSELTDSCGHGARRRRPSSSSRPRGSEGELLPQGAEHQRRAGEHRRGGAVFVTECKKTTSLTGGTCQYIPDRWTCRARLAVAAGPGLLREH